jgi:excisionase family DNA binding protein
VNEHLSAATGERLLSVQEVLELTPLSERFIREEIRTGRLVAHRFGRRQLIAAEDLRRWIRAHREVNA